MSVLNKRKRRSEPRWTTVQRKLLAVLEDQEHRKIGPMKICELAGYGDWAWERATKDPRFVTRLKQLGVPIGQARGGYRKHGGHLEVCLAANPEEELAKESWDMRRLLPDYPRHRPATDFIVDFTSIIDPDLRAQVKLYFRHQLTHWKAGTFKGTLNALRHPLGWFPAGVHLGTINRSHIEDMLLLLAQDSLDARYRGLRLLRELLNHASISPAWPGPRPPRDLLWQEDLPARPADQQPRPLPPDVLDQLEVLLEKAVAAMEAGVPPEILSPMHWDAVLILRRTGMRFEDLAHLKAPDAKAHNGCLVQDSDGYWWIRIDHKFTKMGRDHRIPTRQSDGVIAAIGRQRERIQGIPNHFNEHYLFRHVRGVLAGDEFRTVLHKKLAPHLLHEGKPYRLTAHQFRHSIATEMIDQGIDIYTVKEFLGHRSLAMTERYVQIYLKSLKAKYDAYRAKQYQATAPLTMAAQMEVAPPAEGPEGGWVEGRVGTLYRSPLPDGIGWCEHLAMLDPCPTPPHCPTCPKLRASRQHLPVWESKAKNLLITVESLRDNPVYERARLRHEQELRHTEKVITTIKGEGFWDGRIHNH